MTSNILLIENIAHIREIVANNPNKMVTLVMSTSDNNILAQNINISMKKFLKHTLASKFKDIVFLYVDLSKLKIPIDVDKSPDKKYLDKITKTNLPLVKFLYNDKTLGIIEKADHQATANIVANIKSRIDALNVSSKKPVVTLNIDSITSEQKVAQIPVQQAVPVAQPVNVPASQPVITQPVATPIMQTPVVQTPVLAPAILDPNVLQQQILNKKKLEELEKMKTQFTINELAKIKKAKEEQEAENKSNSDDSR